MLTVNYFQNQEPIIGCVIMFFEANTRKPSF